MSIPIIDERCEIVGWTVGAPIKRAGRTYHPDAERLVGKHYASYVEINDPENAMRAGAPKHWRDGWRCVGLCSEKLMNRQSATQLPLMRVWPEAKARKIEQGK